MDLGWATARDVAAAVRRGAITAEHAVAAALERIAAHNAPLNAFVGLRADAALAEARALDARIARGEPVGALAGVPFGVKDEHHVAGLPTTYGSVPYRDNVQRRDSTIVARLRAAGAIPVGKTNTPEFGSTAFTKNRLFGVTRNPWHLERTPGGSSGGSSAAVAAGLVPMATGGDGGGSLRIPATYTGCFSMKCTFGLVSRGPLYARDWVDTIAKGVITRDVADFAAFLDAVVDYDPLDPDSRPRPERSYVDGLDDAPTGLRFGYSPTLGYARVAPDVRREVERTVDDLARTLGWDVVEVPDRFTDVGPAWALLNGFETAGRLAETLAAHREELGRGFAKGLEIGGRLTAADVFRLQSDRLRLVEELAALFGRVDVLLTPALPTTAFPAGGPMPQVVDGEPLASPIHAVAFSYPFNMSGHPACVVRAGFGDDGLPIGLQLVTERGHDRRLLRLARAAERVRPFDRWPTPPTA